MACSWFSMIHMEMKVRLWQVAWCDAWCEGMKLGCVKFLGQEGPYCLLVHVCKDTHCLGFVAAMLEITMDHKVVPRKRPILRGTTSMVRVTKILVFMVHGPFTRCKPNVDHEEWPCTKKWRCWFFLILSIIKIINKIPKNP